ncbi:MAG: hypothetical protein K1X64_21965 [Myxococcaceae bacterium]|nr:hypothetical protein [Myxococcaceae bacterium]
MKPARLIFFFFCFTACATPTMGDAKIPRPTPSPAAVAMGYQEAVELGGRYLHQAGYIDARFEHAEQPQPNIWRVRFGLAPKGSGRWVELYFDGTRRELMKTATEGGVRADLPPAVP